MAKMAQKATEQGAAGSTWTISGLILVVVAGGLFYLSQDFGESTPANATTGVKAVVPVAVAAEDTRESAAAPDEEMSAELSKYTDKNGVTHYVKRDPVKSVTPDGTTTYWTAEVKVSNIAMAQDKMKTPDAAKVRDRKLKMPRLQRDATSGKYVTGKNRNQNTQTTTTAPSNGDGKK
jgi:cytochrome c1